MKASGRILVLFAMDSAFSRSVLRQLLGQVDLQLRALVLPACAPCGFPVLAIQGRRSIADDAMSAGIPVWFLRHDEEMIERLDHLGARFHLVSCFPRKLSQRVIESARGTFLNLHPSLLPRYRGPDPLFWQLRDAASDTGITLHHVDSRIDAGAIVDARQVPLRAGAMRVEIESILAEVGVNLFRSAISGVRSPRTVAQDERQASYHPLPMPSDYRIPTVWPVARAFSFLRGAAPAGQVFEVTEGLRSIRIRDAQDSWHEHRTEFVVAGERWVEVRFSDGVVRASRA